MRIVNQRIEVPRSSCEPRGDLARAVQMRVEGTVLRWAVVGATPSQLTIEVTSFVGLTLPSLPPRSRPTNSGGGIVVHIVPTGIGCAMGGFAGDAGPASALLAEVSDVLITNPNAVNASDFLGMAPSVVYTEGWSLDAFCAGHANLYVPSFNRVGLVIEAASSGDIDTVVNVVNAMRAVHGLPLENVVITNEPIGSRCVRTKSGAFAGTIDRPEILFQACDALLARGVTAIAVTTDIQDIPQEIHARHFHGEQPNPMGGVEAVISHLVSSRYGIPSAHAPMVNRAPEALDSCVVDPRGAGEYVSRTGLACTILGLWRAPQLEQRHDLRIECVLHPEDLRAIVLPASALGNVSVISTRMQRIPVIAVRENRTVLNVTSRTLDLQDVVEVGSYLEAAGVLVALQKGISLESVRRPLRSVAVDRLTGVCSVEGPLAEKFTRCV